MTNKFITLISTKFIKIPENGAVFLSAECFLPLQDNCWTSHASFESLFGKEIDCRTGDGYNWTCTVKTEFSQVVDNDRREVDDTKKEKEEEYVVEKEGARISKSNEEIKIKIDREGMDKQKNIVANAATATMQRKRNMFTEERETSEIDQDSSFIDDGKEEKES